MRILNLFAGIGGNRSAWGNVHHVTAVEFNQHVAMAYWKRFPSDTVIIGDAWQYFLDHFHQFDFIWASPPCTTHTLLNMGNVGRRYCGEFVKLPGLPDLRLYSLILFCQRFFRGKFVVENVRGYYKPLVKPTSVVGRHNIWSNFYIPNKQKTRREHCETIKESCEVKDVDFKWFMEQKFPNIERRVVIHDCVNPQLAKYIFHYLEHAKRSQKTLF